MRVICAALYVCIMWPAAFSSYRPCAACPLQERNTKCPLPIIGKRRTAARCSLDAHPREFESIAHVGQCDSKSTRMSTGQTPNKKAARWRAAKGPELGGNALCYAN